MKNLFSKKNNGTNNKYLVFTSAGENSNLHLWLKGKQNFDLWVCYYGDQGYRYKEQSDFYIPKKGGKFSNLFYVYQHWKDILDRYEAIFVADDDIIIEGTAIDRLFEIREEYDLWILQPAFDPEGKISHPITKTNPATSMRYTNFVEVTCPLFRKDKLDEFMNVYDPLLVGWGVDWWFLDLWAPDIEGKVAVIDEIPCINPHDCTKGGQREMDLLQSEAEQIIHWERVKKQYNILSEEKGYREYGSLLIPGLLQ